MVKQQNINQAIRQIAAAKTHQELEKLRLHYLGRRGVVTLALRSLKNLPAQRRAEAGQQANQAKQQLEVAIKQRRVKLQQADVEATAAKSPLDLTAPGTGAELGHLHPVQSLQKDIIQIFWQLGFNVASGPEVENDWYNFEALNIPADHPARDMQDTLYLENGAVARTHTSAVQIRYMESHQPPIRIIVPGKVYRHEDEDATHAWAFHQFEALVVDKGMSLADLKGTLMYMVKALFGEAAEFRLRPSYFPYTEPSLEMDARIDPNADWIELGGAGMVHPQVFKNVGIDPKTYSGFAWGFGFERLAIIKYGVDDLRHFWRPDLRFLEQF